MKIAISGKGGVGKTTLVSLLAFTFSSLGKKVIAVDADPDSNLGLSLGLDLNETKNITPLSEMKDLIAERTGTKPGMASPFFKMNPRVDDIPEKYSKNISDGVKLLVLGGLKPGGSGCFCPENAVLKTLFKHLLVSREEIVLIDMEAGIEHLTRGTAESVDALIVVVNSGKKSQQTAHTIEKLADDIGLKKIFVVANRIRSEEEKKQVREDLKNSEILGFMSYSEDILDQDRLGNYKFNPESQVAKETRTIVDNLEREIPNNQAPCPPAGRQ